jgi:hypothetical protein
MSSARRTLFDRQQALFDRLPEDIFEGTETVSVEPTPPESPLSTLRNSSFSESLTSLMSIDGFAAYPEDLIDDSEDMMSIDDLAADQEDYEMDDLDGNGVVEERLKELSVSF